MNLLENGLQPAEPDVTMTSYVYSEDAADSANEPEIYQLTDLFQPDVEAMWLGSWQGSSDIIEAMMNDFYQGRLHPNHARALAKLARGLLAEDAPLSELPAITDMDDRTAIQKAQTIIHQINEEQFK